jgi:hypothetical protein
MASIADVKELLRRETLAGVIAGLLIGASFSAWFYKTHYEYYKEDAAIARENLRKIADETATLRNRISELETAERAPTVKPDRGGTTAPVSTISQKNEKPEQVRPEAIKFIVTELLLPAKALPAGSFSTSQDDYARAAFSVENRSGVDVAIAVQESGYSFGPCFPGPQPSFVYPAMLTAGIKGPPIISAAQIGNLKGDQNATEGLRALRNGEKIAGTIVFWPADCGASMFPRGDTTSGSLTVVVAREKNISILSLNTDNVPIRVVRNSP